MLKPRPGGFNDEYRALLLSKIGALGQRVSVAEDASAAEPVQIDRPTPRKTAEVVAIGASTGGIHALNLLLGELPPEFELPILITQHLPSSFIPVFARQR